MTPIDEISDESPFHPKQQAGAVELLRRAYEEKERTLASRERDLQHKMLQLVDNEGKPRAEWWREWIKPGVLLPVIAMAGGAYLTYQNDLRAINDRLGKLESQLEANDRADKAARDKNLPIVEQTAATVAALNLKIDSVGKGQELIDKQQADRLQSIADSIIDMRRSLETQREKVEELKIEQARRQREGRLMPKDGKAMGPTDEAPLGR